MDRIMFKSKLHRARVTQAELYYEGSLTLDTELMEAADFVPYEKVSVVNVNNGQRFDTYLIPGEAGSRTVCVNGAAARLVSVDDQVIIISYTTLTKKLASTNRQWCWLTTTTTSSIRPTRLFTEPRLFQQISSHKKTIEKETRSSSARGR